MKLQISFDIPDLNKAIDTAAQIADYADIIEVGSILIYRYGIEAVQQFKKAFPQKPILADAKIIDRGDQAVMMFGQAGADWVTLMAGAHKQVLHAACNAASKQNVKIMLDLRDASSVGQSALEAKNIGINALLFHHAYSEQEAPVFIDTLDMVKGNTNLPVFISANITRANLEAIQALKPAGIIVGTSITEAENPREEAHYYYEHVQ